MTSSLPLEAREAFARFITTEYQTAAGGQPRVWPVTPYYTDGGETIDITTGLGYPRKADDARRNPRVSLLFSDPNGSGIESGIQVLVQGIATVDERDLDANAERYHREAAVKVPGNQSTRMPAPVRRMLAWYYKRIYVQVRPERVLIWPHGDITEEPQIHDARIEEVRSGHADPDPDGPDLPGPSGGEPVWDSRISGLGSRSFPTAVLGWVAPDGFPLAVRLHPEPDQTRRRIGLSPEPTGLPLVEGRACLTAHRHAPDFSWQLNFQVRGDLRHDSEGWHLVPLRMIGGLEEPPGGLARYRANLGNMRRLRKNAKQRLAAPPAIEADGS